MLILLAVLATGRATAAPASGESPQVKRTTTTALNPMMLRPMWISAGSAVRPSTRMASSLRQGLALIQMQAKVQVPARPAPRSPFAPPVQPWR
ncbi:MAG: hypothetical protein FJ280_29460 [Planctomycetes bacterium]|nr:hypothetical protein [Planctomycetota bacterium]